MYTAKIPDSLLPIPAGVPGDRTSSLGWLFPVFCSLLSSDTIEIKNEPLSNLFHLCLARRVRRSMRSETETNSGQGRRGRYV